MTDVSVGVRPPCWIVDAHPTWLLHTLKTNCCDLNLAESLCIFTIFLISNSGFYLLNGYDFYFDIEWRDNEKQQEEES